MEFHFEINLRRMALAAYALSFWKTKEMRLKLRQFYYPYGRLGKMQYLEQLINEVIKAIDPASLPGDMYFELIKVIRDVAYKEYDWFHFIKRRKIFHDQSRRQIYDKFCRDVYWTHYGTIDEVKILKYSWLTISNFDLNKLYIMACCFCSEEVITDLWEKIHENSGNNFYKKLCGWFGHHLAAYWFKFKENKVQDFIHDVIIPNSETSDIYGVTNSVEANMLRWSVDKGLLNAFKYFWPKLSAKEKKENIKWCLKKTLDSYYHRTEEECFRKDQYAEIALILINFLDEDLLESNMFTKTTLSHYFKYEKYGFLKMIMRLGIEVWPWQEFFPLLLKKFKNLLNKEMCTFLIELLLEYSPGESNFFQGLIYQIWNKISSKEFKISVVEQNLSKLYEIWDLKSMNLMFNDENLALQRDDYLKKLHPELISLMREKEIDKLNEFIEKILISKNWTENDQQVVKSLYKNFITNNVDSAVKLLNNFSEEDKAHLKCKIDHEIMCYHFVIKNECNEADKFLNWKFETVDKVKDFKKSLEVNKFVIDQIHNLWKVVKEDVELAKQNSNNFLLWLLRKDHRVIAFKVAEILPRVFKTWKLNPSQEKLKYSSWLDFIDDDHFDILEDFLRWSFVNDEGIQEFKKNVFKDRLIYLFPTYLCKGRVEELDKILKCTLNSDEEKFDFLQKELLTKSGILQCKLFISKHACPNKIFEPEAAMKEMTVKFTNFIKWLRRFLKNFDVLKEKLKDWPEISKKRFEEIRRNAPSSEEWYSEGEDYEDTDSLTYCDVENYYLFLNLLDELEK